MPKVRRLDEKPFRPDVFALNATAISTGMRGRLASARSAEWAHLEHVPTERLEQMAKRLQEAAESTAHDQTV
ncbi:MAG: hypothetical protein HY791_00300 [Deltaproteobacteria bacterium]|nr:hypothetical protein [Deltaproteobacteria bacterium]